MKRRLLPLAVGIIAFSRSIAVSSAQSPPAEASCPSTCAELIPTLTPTGENPYRIPLRRPVVADGSLLVRAREIDLLLTDTAQDLGLDLRLSDRSSVDGSEASEQRLTELASKGSSWIISPRIEASGSHVLLRISVIAPGSNVVLTRIERVSPNELAVRSVVMLRDLLKTGRGSRSTSASSDGAKSPADSSESAPRARSEGRATLAMTAAIMGGFVGYSLQKSSGVDDARLTYPLLALGVGVGVGSSLIVSEEWDVGVADAWYLSAGSVYPTVGGLLLARGRNVEPETDRYAYGIAGGLAGVSLASLALSFGKVSDAGAAVVHSGGLLGLGFGAGMELAIRGSTASVPDKGMGYGAIGGVILGGIWGTQVKGSASRIFLIDVGTGLGAVSGAAIASPLVFGERTEGRDRAWICASMSGALVGGLMSYWATKPLTTESPGRSAWISSIGRPYAGVVAQSVAPDGRKEPAYGLGWSGQF